MSDFVSSRINRYEIRERIGAGGMARVFKAWDTTLERSVAIKILYEHLSEDPTFKERFLREARFVANLNHPSIVQVYDFDMFERDGFMHYYMVMSYISGSNLRELLEDANQKGERLRYEQLLKITQNLADALDYAHDNGMVHRDVKPGNILMNQQGDAILTDFGIARMVESNRLTQDGISTGTPLYMSPEQATGQPGDLRSDLYSFGIIVYEMLTGQPPFVDTGMVSVMMKHLTTPIPFVSTALNIVNPELDAVMSKAIAKSPTDRYQRAHDFVNDLQQALLPLMTRDGTDISTPVTPPRRISPSTQTGSPLTAMLNTSISQPPSASNPSLSSQTSTQTIQQTATVSAAFLGGVVIAAVIIIVGAIIVLRDQITPPVSPTNTIQTDNDAAITVPMRSVGNTYFDTDFDANDPENQYWRQGTLDRYTQEITPDGFYRLETTRPMSAETSIIYSDQPYGSIGIEMRATLDESSAIASAYGVVFRYQDPDNYNVFAVDGVGRFSIWTRQDGEWDELRDADENWTLNEAVQPVGESNRVTIEIINRRITGYINNQRVTSVTDSTFTDGQIGIYFAADEGNATVMVDSYKVYPSVPSMTAPQ